ncbi:30S ribosomal protein S4 [Candidatus Dojkabacteria bacterium]|nr:30S ribosomal protein S4 [Candidatus Dojkabacteria bacterium]
MARYTGPKRKLERRENATLFGSDEWRKRPYPPGQHGARRRRPSAYAVQFREKQKVKRMYGLLERQFKNLYKKAMNAKGNTGLNMLQLLELRLDNIVYRLGFAKTRMQSRQMVNHGHILVNGKKVDIPSYTCEVEDEIQLSPKFRKSEMFKILNAEIKDPQIPKWLNRLSLGGQVVSMPERDSIDRGIQEQLIIELYSR